MQRTVASERQFQQQRTQDSIYQYQFQIRKMSNRALTAHFKRIIQKLQLKEYEMSKLLEEMDQDSIDFNDDVNEILMDLETAEKAIFKECDQIKKFYNQRHQMVESIMNQASKQFTLCDMSIHQISKDFHNKKQKIKIRLNQLSKDEEVQHLSPAEVNWKALQPTKNQSIEGPKKQIDLKRESYMKPQKMLQKNQEPDESHKKVKLSEKKLKNLQRIQQQVRNHPNHSEINWGINRKF